MPFTADMNRCTGPKDWAEAHGIDTVGCRHGCKLGPSGMLHPQCSERRSCHLEAQQGRNVYTSRRLSGWTHRQVHTCLACGQEFDSEHRAAFHLCHGQLSVSEAAPILKEAWDKLLRCPWDDWKPARDVV